MSRFYLSNGIGNLGAADSFDRFDRGQVDRMDACESEQAAVPTIFAGACIVRVARLLAFENCTYCIIRQDRTQMRSRGEGSVNGY